MANLAVQPKLASVSSLDGPAGLPLVGNLLQINFSSFHTRLEQWCERFGPIFRFRLGPRNFVVIADADTVLHMFRDRPDTFRRISTIETAAAEMGLLGVFAAEGENWRRQRKIVALALNTAHLKAFFPKLQTTTARLLRCWRGAAATGQPVDLCRDLMRYAVDVTTQLAFGIDVNTIETDGPVIQQHLDKIFPMLNYRVNAPFPYWRYLKLPRDRRLDRALVDVKQRVDTMIAQVRVRMQADPALFEDPTNFLEAIIAAKEQEGLEFSDTDIFGNVCTLLLAGEDTTANTIAWAVKFFIDYPQLYERARTEVDAILEQAAYPETIEQIAGFEYLNAFANETMRLKPIAPIHGMEPLADVALMGYRIPAGTPIILLTRVITTAPEHFGSPGRFKPDRWLVDDAERSEAHDTRGFIPFGTGPRFCPGRNLAVLEIKTVLAMLIRNFDVRMARPAQPVEEKLAFTMMPTNLMLDFRARTGA